jgi:hypothetical protein
MADKPEEDRTEPTLELPSLRLPGFRRRKRRKQPAPAEVTATDAAAREAEGSLTAPIAARTPERVAQGERHETARPRTGPPLPPLPAAVLTGLAVGLLGTALTYASLRGCEAARGTESCGGPGVLLLLVIVVVMALVGALLLSWLRVTDARGTSSLGVGVLCVVVLVTLLQAVFSPWMFVVVPVLGAVAYGLSHWVTTRFVDPVERGPGPDVR